MINKTENLKTVVKTDQIWAKKQKIKYKNDNNNKKK